jgi:LDH2 family malate/lactate/ureidoglycolate dehydrogenase
MDGDQGLGHFVGYEAMNCAIGKAEKFGIGAVGVHNSNHFGTGAYFVQLAAERNMIGVAFSNSFAKVAAHGGIKPVFGTNPIAFGAPGRDGKHMLLDMSTSAVCGSQVLKYAEAGLPLPEGIAGDVHIPGETRWARFQENMLRGIPLDPSTLAALEKLAVRHGIPALAQSGSASSVAPVQSGTASQALARAH